MDNIVKYTKKYPANIQIFKEFPGMEYKDPVESQQKSTTGLYPEPVHSLTNFLHESWY